MAMLDAGRVKRLAAELGFNLCGLTPARPAPHVDAYLRWIAHGQHGEMGYMARPDRVERRRDLNVILPGARTLILVGVDFHTVRLPAALLADPARGRIAAYAWGRDYHDVLTAKLEQLARTLGLADRVYVDTGPILERDHGWQAGLGFIGKNTLLIHPRRGSDFFLGEILTTAEADRYDQPGPPSRCGTCTRCLAACPTEAFPEPYVLDARRCISYLTIEHKGSIAPELRARMGDWVFGCDLCQAVCPWNRFAVQTLEPEFFLADPERAAPRLADLLRLDDDTFTARFAGSPIERIGRDRLVRNACVAAGNSGLADLAPLLEARLNDRAEVVREHAEWGFNRLNHRRG